MKLKNESGERQNDLKNWIGAAVTALLLLGCGGGGSGVGVPHLSDQTTLATNNTAGNNPPSYIPPIVTPLPLVAPPPVFTPPPIVIPALEIISPIASPPPIVIPPRAVPLPVLTPPPTAVPLPQVIPPIVNPPPIAIPPVAPIPFSGYVVKGNTIYDKSTGKSHLFRGIASPSMAWGIRCENCSSDQFVLMRQDWNANVVRLSINQAFWLKSSPKYSTAYAVELARVVSAIEMAGMDVILDNHRSSTGYMADADSVVFWKEVATVYRKDPHVLFELFNEPHGISWDVWLGGGMAPNGSMVHGMQELYDAVRATGATNLVVIGGLNWAYELADIPKHRVVGNNIVYATHPYNYPGKQPNDWDRAFGALAATDPIIATEFGNYDCSTGYYQAFVDYARAKNISWTAWAWYPSGCGFPSIITDSKGTPNAPGAVVKAALWN